MQETQDFFATVHSPGVQMPYVVTSMQVDEASFKCSGLGELAQDNPVQNCRSTQILKTHPAAVPLLLNRHCHLALLKNKKASTMLAALTKQVGVDVGDGKKELCPPAAAAFLRGLNLGSDGAEANEKLWKIVQWMHGGDDEHLPIVLKNLCLQHGVQLVKASVSRIMDMSSPMFCIAKQFSMSSVALKLHDAMFAFVNTHLDWKPVSQYPDWKADPADVQHAHDVLNLCYNHRTSRRRRGGYKQSTVHMANWYAAGNEMVDMTPGNWASRKDRRIVHPCKQGCCMSREEAVDKLVSLAGRLILHHCICVPAENKWLSLFPVMMDVCLMSAWYGFLQYAEEFINGSVSKLGIDITEDDFWYIKIGTRPVLHTPDVQPR